MGKGTKRAGKKYFQVENAAQVNENRWIPVLHTNLEVNHFLFLMLNKAYSPPESYCFHCFLFFFNTIHLS